MTTNQTIVAQSLAAFIGTYSRFPVAMISGQGCTLTDADGREYLDFLSGIAVCGLGHCHPAVTQAICEQAGRLVHVSNLFHTLPQTELAALLVANSFADKVFFANSGAEANEAAIKLARIASPAGRYEVISLSGSFHGRTLATVAATGQSKFHQGFEPLPQGFVHAPFGDLAALARMINPATCAILCEPLQGESGVRPLAVEYVKGLRQLCDEHDLLLIFDEVQVGMGRTGTLFAYEQLGVTPDIMTLAKAIANGLPLGAMLTRDRLAQAFTPGTHASTFGGNPVACAAGLAVLKTMLAPDFLPQVRERGQYLAARLAEIAARHPALARETRGLGLIQGLVLTEQGLPHGPAIVNSLFEQGVLANFAGNTALRFIPPLIVTTREIDRMIAALDRACQAVGG
ncbi:MAG: aspartate aminotransferase family protein [Desulfobacteraceae bacterium]|nr:aspartate aminotransferase family protein [Desulfobacteraceae bacterium]